MALSFTSRRISRLGLLQIGPALLFCRVKTGSRHVFNAFSVATSRPALYAMERSKQREHEPSSLPKSTPPAPYPFPASNSPNPNHSPRLPSLLNPATAAHPPSTQQGAGLGHGHGHSASFSGPSVNYRNNLLSPVSSPPPPHPVSLPGTHPSSPTILGPPFQPNESLGSKSVGRGRGHSESTVSLPRTDLDLPSSPPSAASFDVLSSAPFVSPSTTIRPDSSVPFSSPGEQYEGGLGASRSSSSSKLDLSSSFRMRSRSASRTRVSGSTGGEDGGAQSPSAMTQNPSRSSLTSWWKHPAQGDAPAQPQSGQIIPSSSTPLSSSSRHPSPHAVGQGRGRAHTHSISRPWHTKSFFDSHSAGKTDKSRRHTVATTVEAAGARKSTTPTTPVATLNESTERKDASEEGGGESSTEGKNSGHDTVPLEQMQNWETTRKRVAQAASSILGTSALVAHEILLTSVELFELAPVPGLAAAARTLLEIWDSVQEVDSNRLQCLRLTERCADILLSVRQEVYEAGEHVSLELKLPIAKLSETFQNVHNVLAKQAARPFLQRYLKRDEISKQLQQCDMDLHDALGMFSLTIQVRILKQVRASEAKRQKETEELLKNVLTLVNRSATSPTPPVQSPPAQSQPVQSPPPLYAEQRTASFIQSTSAEQLHTEQRLSEEQRPPFPYGPTLSSNDPNSFPYTTALPPQPLLLSGSSSGSGLDGGAVTNPKARGEAITEASASQQSLLADIPGLQGLPASSSHSSLSLDVLNEVSTQAQGLELGTSVVPTVSVTPSSRPSTASRSSTDTTPKQHLIPVPPVQLIPTRSTIEAGAPVLDAIRNQLVTSSSSQTIIPSSSTLTRIGPSTLGSTSTTSSSGMPSAIPVPPALIPSPSTLPASLVLPTLLSLTKYQNALDAEGDYVDLRNVMRAALSKGSDVEMMRVLGLGLRGTKGPFDADDIDGDVGASKGGGGRRCRRLDAGEIVEAIKTLQRAQEALLEKERWEATLDKREGTDGQGVASDEKSQIHDDHVHGNTGTDVGSGGGERPGFYRRGSASSAKALAKIKRRMSIQSSYSSNSIPSQPPTPLNETIIDEEVEVEEPTEVGGVRKAVVMRKGTSGSGGARLLRSKTTSSSSTSTSKTNDSAISQAGSGSGRSRGSGSGREGMKEKPNTLDKEFIESSIDALRRLSRTTSTDTKSRRDSDSARELPSWTITRFEIDPEEKIGVGFFSDVFKGTWRAPSAPSAPLSTSSSSAYVFSPPSRTVAIKVLAETTPRSLFLGETAIWKKLNHPNVLELYGASSASGDPPWFFVSPYLENGSLVEFLRRNSTPDPISGKSKLPTGLVLPENTAYDRYVEGVTTIAAGGRVRTGSLPGYPGWNGGGLGSLVGTHAVHASDGMGLGASAAHPSGNAHTRGRSGSGSTVGGSGGFGLGVGEVPKEWDLLRFMHEIAKGMEYLHSQGVLHGDLKAANVLVDDRIHCVIGDFGQSEMRSEAYRISGTPPPRVGYGCDRGEGMVVIEARVGRLLQEPFCDTLERRGGASLYPTRTAMSLFAINLAIPFSLHLAAVETSLYSTGRPSFIVTSLKGGLPSTIGVAASTNGFSRWVEPADKAVRAQIAESVSLIAELDFPDQWDNLIDQLVNSLLPTDYNTNLGVLQTGHSIFRQWRSLVRSDRLYTEINLVFSKFLTPFLQLFRQTAELLTRPGQSADQVTLLGQCMVLLVEIYYDFTCHNLPPAIEDSHVEFFGSDGGFFPGLMRWEPAELEVDPDSTTPSIPTQLKTSILLVVELFIKLFPDALQSSSASILSAAPSASTAPSPASSSSNALLSQSYDGLISQSLRFISTSVRSTIYKSLFISPTNPGIISSLIEGAIIPNAFLRTSDVERFSDDPLEWIRTDLAGSAAGTEGATRRQAAGDVLQALVGCGDNVEFDTTRVVRGWVERMWKSKDGVIWLISLVANRGGTTGQGVTSTNKLVDVMQFFEKNVFPDLQALEGKIDEDDEEQGAKGGVHPILKIDAIRFLYTFRNQLTKQQLLAVLPLLIKALDDSENYVTYTYAAIAIEKVLGIRFAQADVRDFAPQLLGVLMSKIERADTPEKIAENDHLMKAVMRAIITARQTLIPTYQQLLNRLVAVLGVISKNPSNPKFDQYIFESLSALMRFVTSGSPTTIPTFESTLIELFTIILMQDIDQYIPYVFQLLAQMLSLHPTSAAFASAGQQDLIPPQYRSLLSFLLAPTVWQQKGSIPGLVKLLKAYLARDAKGMVQGGQIGSISGILQQRLIVTACRALTNYIIGVFESIQSGLWGQILNTFVLPLVPKMPHRDRNMAAVGMTRLLFQSRLEVQQSNAQSWPLHALIKLFSEPQFLVPANKAFSSSTASEDSGAAALGLGALTEIDFEEQTAGYQAAYSRLAASESAEDAAAEDPVRWVDDAQKF
ncbi:hypothetical protein D9757_008606 [Collybiopsis confluens]|uniref:Protein kinase domain-containing protein n=1 Tax=Collybiopsis confluens TaxID=2823264 RepID=A0A8H5HMW0_9AGAR|nr:hypothetical protein D9757_008606 [Collybiopsis confluens]